MNKFFDTDHTRTVLVKFKHRMDVLIVPSDDFEKQRNKNINLVINSMANKPEQWDEHCQITIGWLSDSFISTLSDMAEFTKRDLDLICSMCFRFLFELELSTQKNLPREFEEARRFVLKNIDSFEDGEAKGQIEYAMFDMPINILKSIINSDEIQNIKDFNAVSQRIEKQKKDWDDELAEREKRVARLQATLLQQEKAYNFVGLSKAFSNLTKKKKWEAKLLFISLRRMGMFLLVPLMLEFIFLMTVYANSDYISADHLIVTIPIFSIEIILIYFFRIILLNHRSVKAQIMQLELRQALCQFIQSYVAYSSEIKTKDAKALEKFENLIFSGILSNPEKLPSTFDGIEQISEFMKNIRGQ